jgi:hypothetical protein
LGYSFRPLQILLLYPVYRLAGLNAVPYHLLDLLLHVGCSILVFFLGLSLSGKRAVGTIAALVFSVYPRHHEVLAYVAALYGPMTLLGLAAVVSFIAYLRRNSTWLYILSVSCFGLALLSHEIVVALLPLLYAAEVVTTSLARGRKWTRSLGDRRTWKKYVPFAVLVAAAVAIALSTKTSTKLSQASTSYHFAGLGAETARTLAAYLVYLVFPQARLRSLDVGPVGAALALAAAALLLWLLLKGTILIRYGLLWMVATLLPFVLLGSFGNQDRYFYLSAVGYALVAGEGATGLWERSGKHSAGRVLVALVLLLYLASCVLVVQERIGAWRVAGAIAGDVVGQVEALYPRVRKGSLMYFVDLPRDYRGAHVFGTGIKGAMRLLYGDPDLAVLYGWDEPLVQRLASEEGAPPGSANPGTLVFVYREGQLVDRTSSYALLRDDIERACWYDRYNVTCAEAESDGERFP